MEDDDDLDDLDELDELDDEINSSKKKISEIEEPEAELETVILEENEKIEKFDGKIAEDTRSYIEKLPVIEKLSSDITGAKNIYKTKLAEVKLTPEELKKNEIIKDENGQDISVIHTGEIIKDLKKSLAKPKTTVNEKNEIKHKIKMIETMESRYIPNIKKTVENILKIRENIDSIDKKAKFQIKSYKEFKISLKANQDIQLDFLKKKSALKNFISQNKIDEADMSSCKDETVKNEYLKLKSEFDDIHDDRLNSGNNLINSLRAGYNFNALIGVRNGITEKYQYANIKEVIEPIPKVKLEEAKKQYDTIRNKGVFEEKTQKATMPNQQQTKEKQQQPREKQQQPRENQRQSREEIWVPLNLYTKKDEGIVEVDPLFKDGTVPNRVAKINYPKELRNELTEVEKLTLRERFLNWKKSNFPNHYKKKTEKLEKELKIQKRYLEKDSSISYKEKNKISNKIQKIEYKINKFRISDDINNGKNENDSASAFNSNTTVPDPKEVGNEFENLNKQVIPPEEVVNNEKGYEKDKVNENEEPII